MSDEQIVFQSATELASLIKSRKLSPVEVAQAYLGRIQTLNPKVNTFITVTSDVALARARQAEREIGSGRYRGPLHGLPYAPKDIVATKGIRTTNGSKVTADWVPDYESTITTRLNDAGAILLGKLNLMEFAVGGGVLSGFGPVRNPWALGYSPGGSSSGSAAALAACIDATGDRHGYRWIYSGACQQLRDRGHEADLWPRQPIWRDNLELDAGSRRADDAERGGCRHDAAGDGRTGSKGQRGVTRSCAGLFKVAQRRREKGADRSAQQLLLR